MSFNKSRALKSLIRVKHGPGNWGMGFRRGSYLLTAFHCLPQLPNNLWDDTTVEVADFDRKAKAFAVVVACDPVSDIAVLSDATLQGTPLPTSCLKKFRALKEVTESASLVLTNPGISGKNRVHIFTHQKKWIAGHFTVFGKSKDPVVFLNIELSGGAQVLGGTSGAPIFNDAGEVLGIVSTATIGRSEMMGVCLAGVLSPAMQWNIKAVDFGISDCPEVEGDFEKWKRKVTLSSAKQKVRNRRINGLRK